MIVRPIVTCGGDVADRLTAAIDGCGHLVYDIINQCNSYGRGMHIVTECEIGLIGNDRVPVIRIQVDDWMSATNNTTVEQWTPLKSGDAPIMQPLGDLRQLRDAYVQAVKTVIGQTAFTVVAAAQIWGPHLMPRAEYGDYRSHDPYMRLPILHVAADGTRSEASPYPPSGPRVLCEHEREAVGDR